MENKNTIREELQVLCPAVANLDRKNVYTVPDGYFDKLGENIIQFIKENEEPAFGISSAMPFNVPQGYFDDLAGKILQKAKQQNSNNEVWNELNTIAPLLNTISKVPVFSVPDNYFESFEVVTPSAKQAKVVPFGGVGKVLRYAVAAIVIGIMAIGGFLFFNKEDKPVVNVTYNPEEIKKLSDQEIIEYLNTTSFADVIPSNPKESQEDEDFESFLKNLSEQEIEEYLKENPEPAEIHSKEG